MRTPLFAANFTSARHWTIRLVVLLLAGVWLLAACAPQSGDARPGQPPATPSMTRPAVLAGSASLPAGYGPIDALAGDPAEPGVWFWDSTMSVDAIFHLLPDGTLTSYPVLTGTAHLTEQARSGIAVSATGIVWLGINRTLVELNAQTGAVRTWTIPEPRDNPSAEQFQPPKLVGLHAVQALAVGPTDQVAIALSDASDIEAFDPNTSAFSTLHLPKVSDEPLSVAYSGDGSLAVGMSDLATGGLANQLLLISPTGVTATATLSAPGSAWEVAPVATATFVAGSTHPELVTVRGVVAAVQSPTTLIGSAAATVPLALQPDGQLVGIAAHGLIEFSQVASSPSSAAASAVILTLPTVPCGGAVEGSPPLMGTATISATPLPPGSQCPSPSVRVMTTDAAGNLWVVAPNSSTMVGRVTPVRPSKTELTGRARRRQLRGVGQDPA